MDRPLEWRIETHAEIPSTQDRARAYAVNGEAEGRVVHALRQSAGYGRHGRGWTSQEGNLFLSFILRPACSAQAAGQISLLCAVALAEVMARYCGDVRLKWPNDVLLGARKAAGILLESEIGSGGLVSWVVLGVGVNVARAPDPAFAALKPLAGRPVHLERFRDEFLNHFKALYSLWSNSGFESIKARWLALAHPVGASVSVKRGADHLEGAFAGLDDSGALILETAQGSFLTITAGEIFIMEKAPYVTGD